MTKRPPSYPRLPDILDADTLAAVSTLQRDELTFARGQGRKRHQYLRALYLKAFMALGHGHLEPKDLPRQMRARIVEQLEGEDALLDVHLLDKRERSRILADVRAFLRCRTASKALRMQVQMWLSDGLAQQEDEMCALLVAAAERFVQLHIEIPPLEQLTALVEGALRTANASIEKRLCALLDEATVVKLLATGPQQPRSLLDDFKEPAGRASPISLDAELQRLRRIDEHQPHKPLPDDIHHSKVAMLVAHAQRCNAAELRRLRPVRRRAILACFMLSRRAEQLDRLAEMFIELWRQTKATANEYAETLRPSDRETAQGHRTVLRDLLKVILTSSNPPELWHGVHNYKTSADYAALRDELQQDCSRAELFADKLLDHYPTMRRFLPDWYRLMPLASTTTDSTLLRAMAVLRVHAQPETSELPRRGTPTSFLTGQWQKRAVERVSRTGQVAALHKAPYELGWVEAAADALKTGTLAVRGSRRFAEMTDHLLDRDEFIAHYAEHLEKLGLPETAQQYYSPTRDELDKRLQQFDAAYDKSNKQFWVNKDGMLGFGRTPSSRTQKRKVARLSKLLLPYMPTVSIFDILLDCHRWTDYASVFRPLGGRQHMREQDKLLHVLAALYAYGCNCGPTQAARAVGLEKSQVVYIRRQYMGTKSLIEATAILASVYERTAVAQRLGEPGVLLTDAMHLRTLKQSLTARQYYRDRSHASVLLYQHVTPDCVCKFTQALLVNISEGLHMLHGVLQCRDGQGKVINICDSGGKSNLVFGLGRLLNIELNPRPRSRNMKLWAPSDKRPYQHINEAFAGTIRWEFIEEGWVDMVWILASIAAGTAPPALIFERLANQPKHPATRGFEELGKLERSNYLLRYGMDIGLRRFVVAHTSRREHWNGFTRQVLAFGDVVREKTKEGQEEVFWFLTAVQSAIVLWNALALDKAIDAARRDGHVISEADLQHALPTLLEHINFVGRFDVNLRRRPPFKVTASRRR